MAEFDPTTDPDVQEAMSNIWAAGVRILALSSGRFAIFSRGTILHGIHDTLREEVIRDYCEAEMRDYLASMEAERVYKSTAPAPIINPSAQSADELGL